MKNLPSNVMGLERTESAQELADYYSMADVFVNATLEDNFPTTNLEALSCGTPVITYETGGSSESLDEKCGRSCQRARKRHWSRQSEKRQPVQGLQKTAYKEQHIIRNRIGLWTM